MEKTANNTYLSITQWAEEDRPREKLLLKGKASLSDAELIGILLGSGTKTLSAVDLAKQILSSVNNDLHSLAKMSVTDLCKFKGIGEAKAISIVSALELGRRRKDTEPVKQPRITCSGDAYELMKPELTDLQHEEFWIILLKRNNQVIKKAQVSAGGVSGTMVDPKIIFKKGLDVLASGMILVHNHPSGNLKPSESDNRLTKKLKNLGEMMEIPVYDHIIFTDHGYFSYSDESMM
ncbi:RadC family protein [Marinoscillum sp.]|uniref:RadC family protein n=1 Tax=Marinoscillum sp. TaxID=2024838 RepID=UPI003BACB28E